MNSTLTLPVNIFTWKKEKPCSPGATKIFLPRRAWFLLLPSENVQWKCKFAAHQCIIKKYSFLPYSRPSTKFLAVLRLSVNPTKTLFLVKMSFICMRMKNDFHIKGWAPTLALKQRFGELGNGLLYVCFIAHGLMIYLFFMYIMNLIYNIFSI